MDNSVPDFGQRVAATFSGLGGDAASNLWTVRTRKQVEPDAVAGNSSEEEDPPGPPSLLSWGVITAGEDPQEEPSAAFRSAFEQEEDEDEFDRAAYGGSLSFY